MVRGWENEPLLVSKTQLWLDLQFQGENDE